MMDKNLLSLPTGEVLEEGKPLTLAELCQICNAPENRIMEIVEEGIVEPIGEAPENWCFYGASVKRVRFVLRLERDLGVNAAGSALALELLEELEVLRKRVKHLGEEYE